MRWLPVFAVALAVAGCESPEHGRRIARLESQQRSLESRVERLEAAEVKAPARIDAPTPVVPLPALVPEFAVLPTKHPIAVDDLRIDAGTTGFMEETVGIFGVVTNTGAKTVKRVELRFYFLDNAGKRIGEGLFAPVNVGAISFSAKDKSGAPLKSNYKRDFGYAAGKYAPTGWSKRAEVEVKDVVYE